MGQIRSTWHVAYNVAFIIGMWLLDLLHPTDEELKEREL